MALDLAEQCLLTLLMIINLACFVNDQASLPPYSHHQLKLDR